jgi:hypothetical protein
MTSDEEKQGKVENSIIPPKYVSKEMFVYWGSILDTFFGIPLSLLALLSPFSLPSYGNLGGKM